MKREDAIAIADRAAASVLGTTAARVAGFAASYDLSASVLVQFLESNPDLAPGARAETLYLFANGFSKKPRPPAFDKHAVPFEVFVAVWSALLPYVTRHAEDEAERARARQASLPKKFGGRTFADRAPGFGASDDAFADRGGWLKKD